MVFRAGQAGAEVGIDEVGPAVVRHEAVQRGKVARICHSASETPAIAAGEVAMFMGERFLEMMRPNSALRLAASSRLVDGAWHPPTDTPRECPLVGPVPDGANPALTRF